jgi:hypothetical protein
MNRISKSISLALMMLSLLSTTPAQQRDASSTITPQPTVTSGTVGRIAKFITIDALGNSNMAEDKFGKIGIGTTTPTSPLTVQGMVEITLGGLKFPDGSVQTTAATTNVIHDSTLKGNGSAADPLGVVVPLTLAGSAASAPVLSVKANDGDNPAIDARAAAGGIGAYAAGGFDPESAGPGLFGDGGAGFGDGGAGVIGRGGNGLTNNGTGLVGIGGNSTSPTRGGTGVEGSGSIAVGAGHTSGHGVVGIAGMAFDGAAKGKAGRFEGDVEVTGTLSKAGGSFKIDHPLDPENKYLSHSFVESPDMMNIYNGNVTTDQNGIAVVVLPDYFDSLNRDFRYQLTVVGQFAQAIVAEEVKNNRFTIQTSVPGVKVSWLVTGVRQDAWANKNRIPVEQLKPETERGRYLHPEVFNQPEERGIASQKHTELKQRQLQTEQAPTRHQ